MESNIKTIGLCGNSVYYSKYWDDIILKESGLGGTETWFIEISQEFAKKGYNVILFCFPEQEHYDEYGVFYANLDNLKLYKNFYFDVFIAISAANINSVISDKFYLVPSCEDIYDWPIYEKNKNKLMYKRVDKIIYLSNFHKSKLKEFYPYIPDEKFLYIPLGTNSFKDFNDIENIKKENSMVWSSSYIRNLKFFIDNIFPEIKKEIPDFKLYICSYAENSAFEEYWRSIDGIKVLNNLNKEKLHEYQKKSKYWIYPNFGLLTNNVIFHETFCLTAVENALAKNIIICFGKKDGIETTLNNFSGFINGDFFDEYNYYYNNDLNAIKETMIAQFKRAINHEDIAKNMINSAYASVQNYKWEKVIKLWINEIENE